LWIGERQLGRRNINDSQRAVITDEVRELRSAIAVKERASKGGRPPSEKTRLARPNLEGKTTSKLKAVKPGRTTTVVAKEFKVKERDLRTVQETQESRGVFRGAQVLHRRKLQRPDVQLWRLVG
jgi:hypothetical protein